MESFSQGMDVSEMSDGCFFRGKTDICKESHCRPSSSHEIEELYPTNQSEVDVSQTGPDRRVLENKTGSNKQLASRSFIVSSEDYRTLLDNLYIARLWFLRARNITNSQLNVYKEEAIGHMQKINRIINEELDNPDASARHLAEESVKAGIEVIRNQQVLNRIEMEELVKNLDGLLDALSSDVKEVQSLAEPESEEESKQGSYTELILDYGHWWLFVLCVFIILITGLYHCFPTLEGDF